METLNELLNSYKELDRLAGKPHDHHYLKIIDVVFMPTWIVQYDMMIPLK